MMSSVRRASRSGKSRLLAIVVLIGCSVLVLGARATVATGEGADFATVFNEPARSIENSAEVVWIEGEPLLRSVEPQTMEAIEFAWVRAFQAISNAAANGSTEGIDVWFSGPAREQAHQLIVTGAMDAENFWSRYEVTPQFTSVDGQIFVASIARFAPSLDDETGEDVVRVVFILRDGNWRVEHLVRLPAA